MPRRNDHISRQGRKERADIRQEARDSRLNDEQIAVLLSRGADPECKEIRRLSVVK